MKRERGSASVLALIMLLFLAFAGGSWVMMLAHENATALSDEKEQQAWYAAEAGMKRAKVELEAKNSGWDWLTSAEQFSKNNFDYQKVNKDQNDSYAKYGVFIAPRGSTSLISGTPTTDTEYDITSVGEYMGTTKVIKDTFKPLPSGGGGAHGNTDLVEKESKPSVPGDALTLAGGTVTVKNSVSNNAGVVGSIYASSITDNRGDKESNPVVAGDLSTVKGLYTKIADSAFAESTYGTFTKYSSIEGNNSVLTLSDSQLVSIDWPLKWTASWSETGGLFNYMISGGNGAVLYFNLQGSNNNPPWSAYDLTGYNVVYTTDGIKGPTSGKPLTLIFDEDVCIDSEISGNVRIIAKGKVYLANRKQTGKLMIVANDDVYLIGSTQNCLMFVSSDGNVISDSSGEGFTGQIQAAGNVILTTKNNTYNNWVQTDSDFVLPEMELHGS